MTVQLSNDGVTVNFTPVTGAEAADASRASLIALDGLSVALNDDDGSEAFVSILLADLPDGFLVYTGSSAENVSQANMASNAGGTSGTNTWVLSGPDGALPPYVAILPPQYWSGTLAGLKLFVTSGEPTLSEVRTDTFDLAPITITPVANGILITPTNTFGAETGIVPLNLNASMADARDASVPAATDESQETATVQLTGLGAYAAFYLGTTLLTEGVSYDAGSDTYTLTDLSQSDLDALGFRQAVNALTDQDPASGTQIRVRAWTEDGDDESEVVETIIRVNITRQLATTGDDTLLWTGAAINGQAGFDTVQLRYGESLSGAELTAQLRNIEVLDLGIAGQNVITLLTPEHVGQMTDGNNELRIEGTAEDSVTLDGDWRDNEDGTYTGFLAGGDEVTLVVTGDVTVTPPDGGFFDPLAGFVAFGAFGDEALGLGLGGLDGSDPEQDEEEDESVTLDGLFSGPGDDLTGLLPGTDADPAPGGGEPDLDALPPPPAPAWADDLHEDAY